MTARIKNTNSMSVIEVKVTCDLVGACHMRPCTELSEKLYIELLEKNRKIRLFSVSKYELCQAGEEIEFVFVPHKMHFFDCETENTIVL